MDKVKRGERLAVMSRVLTATPNKIYTLSYFCEMFSAAKSTISEDTAILARTFRTFRLGTIETVTGAGGGVRYRMSGNVVNARPFVSGLCTRLMDRDRILPGGYLYLSDILSEPDTVRSIGELIAAEYYDTPADFILTMETKGIPVALETAAALHLPLVIARRSIKVYEGGTARGMCSLMAEFGIKVQGACFVLSVRGSQRVVEDEKAVMVLDPIVDNRTATVRPGAWIK